MKALCTLAVLLTVFAGSSVVAAEISHSTLAAMGLGGVTIMSDHEDAQIRGMGHSSSGANVSGTSWVAYLAPPAVGFASDQYSDSGKKHAQGDSLSQIVIGTALIIQASGNAHAGGGHH